MDSKPEQKIIKHKFKSQFRTGSVVITEQPDKVVVRLRFSKYGKFSDTSEVTDWLRPIFTPYDYDPRPVVMDNPITGEVATITDEYGPAVAIIRKYDA